MGLEGLMNCLSLNKEFFQVHRAGRLNVLQCGFKCAKLYILRVSIKIRMKYQPLDPAIFINNRKRFVSHMLPNSIAVFVSNDEWPSNGDALHSFKQNSDLYWLSGIVQEDSMVILFPDNPDPKFREVLVLVRPNELKEKWDGKRLRAGEAKAIAGMATVVWLDSLDALLQGWIHLADNIYLDSNENDRKASAIRSREYRFIDEMKAQYPLHHYMRAAKIMKELRAIKSKEEIVVVQKAIDNTDKVGEEATQQFLKIGLLKKSDVKNEDQENRAYRKYLYHGISHHLGIDVHDLGTRTAPIKAGMLFTIEPGIYIEEEQMGVRIENNFWITKNGNTDLMKNIPITVEEIESYMKR